ncbi:MAG: SCO family protein [Pseudomonadota bacterium]
MKTVRLVLWMLVIVMGAAVAGIYVGQTFIAQDNQAGAGTGAAGLASAFARSRYEDAGGPFTLIGTDGDAVTEKDFRGKPLAIFFGFTHCPDVCPTSLLDASGWLDALGEDADKMQFVFVSVDPERDTPEVLGQYVSAFDDRIIGLTASSQEAVADVAERYRVYFEKVPLREGDYTVNHTADTLLFDADGEFSGFIPYMQPNIRLNEPVSAEATERTVETLRALVNS